MKESFLFKLLSSNFSLAANFCSLYYEEKLKTGFMHNGSLALIDCIHPQLPAAMRLNDFFLSVSENKLSFCMRAFFIKEDLIIRQLRHDFNAILYLTS